jgi:hypothetical protein
MFPWLHQDVSKAVSAAEVCPRWINTQNDHEDSNNKYSTNVMGRFTCSNDGCPTRSWSSKTVSIWIRGYPENGYNAVIFNQRCKDCNQLGDLTLDKNSYVERVAYRLKKWAGVLMEQQHYAGKGGRPPHMRELCEGCKRGYCQQETQLGRRTV